LELFVGEGTANMEMSSPVIAMCVNNDIPLSIFRKRIFIIGTYGQLILLHQHMHYQLAANWIVHSLWHFAVNQYVADC
jgi:hypothetical protein